MFSPEKSVLLVIDVQGKLAELMHQKDVLFKNIGILIQAAQTLKIPILWTEQIPEKLGATTPAVSQYLQNLKPLAKSSFSCVGDPNFTKALGALYRKQVIATGIESHVCVYQTVSQLLASGYKVQVVSDAVSARTAENKTIGLSRMQAEGGVITSTEMILFELLKTAGHDQFKKILGLIR